MCCVYLQCKCDALLDKPHPRLDFGDKGAAYIALFTITSNNYGFETTKH